MMICIYSSLTDVDECTSGEADCAHDSLCVNMPGFYACQCKLGYRLIDDLCQGKNQGRADPKLMLRGYFLSYCPLKW